MRTILKTLLVLPLALAPLIGGGFVLQIGNPAANPAASAKHGVVTANITSCYSPEKTSLDAVAEGLVLQNEAKSGTRHPVVH